MLYVTLLYLNLKTTIRFFLRYIIVLFVDFVKNKINIKSTICNRVNFQSKFHSGRVNRTYSNKDFVVELSMRIVSRERSDKNVTLKCTKEQAPDT